MHAMSITYTSPETPTCEVPSNGVIEISLLPVCTVETSIYTRSSYPEAVSTLHYALENGADLHVNERQNIRHYRPRSTEERRRRKKNVKSRFFTSRGAYVNLRYIAMLYTYSIGNKPYNAMVVFKKRVSVPSARYSSVCNVLCRWRIWLIPTYRIYRLYDNV